MNKRQLLILASTFFVLATLFFISNYFFIPSQNLPIITSQEFGRSQLAAIEGAGSGLVGWWKLDDGSGSVAVDSSGNGNSGALINGPTWVSGKVGTGALSFNGTNNYLSLEKLVNSYLSAFNDFSISLWFYSSTASQPIGTTLFGSALNSSDRTYIQIDSNGGLSGGIYNGSFDGGLAGFSSYPLNTWNHVVMTKSGDTVTLYLNNTPRTTGGGLSTDSSARTSIGSQTNRVAGFFKGSIDDVRIYNRALSASEVQSLYSYTAPANTPAIDSSAPSIPSNLTATAVSSSQINLSWGAASDNVGVAGYNVYRNNSLIANTSLTYYYDTGLSQNVPYSYTVSAYDAAGNVGTKSQSVGMTTLQDSTPISYSLSVSKSGTGSGTVSGGSISCGSTCSQTSVSGTSVTLTATPSSGSTFVGWSGSCSGTGSCTVALNSNKSVTATFNTQTSSSINNWYVSTNGSSQGSGSLSNPWDLKTALANPGGVVKPGDTIWVRGGTYRPSIGTASCSSAATPCGQSFTSSLTGTEAKPIIVRNYSNERAIIDGLNSANPILQVIGNYTWYWGLEITDSSPLRVSNQADTFPTDVNRGAAIALYGNPSRGNKFINMIMHNAHGGGVVDQNMGADSEYYGNLVYYTGWHSEDRGHGHGFYIQNDSSFSQYKKFLENIIFDNMNQGVQAYGSSAARLDNLTFEGNAIFGAGSLTNSSAYALLLGGGYPVQNGIVKNNYLYWPSGNRTVMNLGYEAGTNNTVLSNNVIGGHLSLSGSQSAGGGSQSNFTMTGNTVFNAIPQYLFESTYPNNTYYNDTRPTTGYLTFVRPNKYESGRANVVIYNMGSYSSVPVDFSSVLNTGDTYDLHNVENYFGDIIHGTYQGGTVNIPMTGHTQEVPVGTSTPRTWFPNFGAFVLIKTNSSSIPQVVNYSLSVSKTGTGSGTVSGGSISCGSICSQISNSGTSVTLTATPSSGSTFAGWSGSCSGTGTCTVALNSNKSVTATFSISSIPVYSYSLSVTKSGTGSGTVSGGSISCGLTCSQTSVSGTSVTLTATPSSGSTFAGWSGSCSGTGSCTIALNSNKSVVATFNLQPQIPVSYSLSVIKSGTGSGTVSGGSISCGSTCSQTSNSGTLITLTAVPSSSSTFVGWSGSCSGIGTCSIAFNSNKSVTAVFNKKNSQNKLDDVVSSNTSETNANTNSGTVTSNTDGTESSGGSSSGSSVKSNSSGNSVTSNSSSYSGGSSLYSNSQKYSGGTSSSTSTKLALSSDSLIKCPEGYVCTPKNNGQSSSAQVSSASAPGSSITYQLTLNSKGSQVVRLKWLLSNGAQATSTSDVFDQNTLALLQAFQCKNLSVCSGNPYTTGYGGTGPRTRAALSALIVGTTTTASTLVSTSSNFTRDLSFGFVGEDVKNLQKYLNNSGYVVSYSGAGSIGQETTYFGSATKAALVKFQKDHNIPSTGYFGPITRKFIAGN